MWYSGIMVYKAVSSAFVFIEINPNPSAISVEQAVDYSDLE